MKKITIILPTLGGGGAEKLHVNLANYWSSKKYLLEIILLRGDAENGVLIPLLSSNIKVVNLNTLRMRDSILPLVNKISMSESDILITAMWPLTSIVVISWILSGKKGKLFLSEHESLSLAYSNISKFKYTLLKKLIQFTYPKSNGIITVSEGLKKDLSDLGNISNKLIRVIFNPTSNIKLKNTLEVMPREPSWNPNSAFKILSVGRLTPEKDHLTLIKAFSQMPKELNINLVILGEGSMRPLLEELIISNNLSDRVFLPGYQLDPNPWYKSADLFVLSSIREGFGNVIVEALEHGVPIVSTNCPSGPAEILENGRYGKLVPVKDTHALANAMLESLKETHSHEDLKNRAKDFSVEKISEEYLEYFFHN
ncbi:glycosyltransferase [Polynucleobacter rarus]|uniref:glycosyltransferase n=1 Tax=Polynucleobacter rarus TaxID=556055 RepID=UPI000D3E776A|nr:glycosyltransferase [Polynucleobacter rarus]